MAQDRGAERRSTDEFIVYIHGLELRVPFLIMDGGAETVPFIPRGTAKELYNQLVSAGIDFDKVQISESAEKPSQRRQGIKETVEAIYDPDRIDELTNRIMELHGGGGNKADRRVGVLYAMDAILTAAAVSVNNPDYISDGHLQQRLWPGIFKGATKTMPHPNQLLALGGATLFDYYKSIGGSHHSAKVLPIGSIKETITFMLNPNNFKEASSPEPQQGPSNQ